MTEPPAGRGRRIALVTSSFAPYFGGVEEHVRNVARVLTARGHDVVVWTVARDGVAAVREHEGINVRDLPTPLPDRSIGGVATFLLRLPGAVAAWVRALRASRPEVLHVQCFGPNGTYATLLARLLRQPLVMSSHGETLADDSSVFESSALARRSLRWALTTADGVSGCSQVVITDLEQRFGLAPARGELVPNGIDLDEPAGAPPAGLPSRYVAAVGRLQYLKGFDLLLRAFAAADLPTDIGLVIGGGGPEAEPLARLAADLGIRDRVVLPGRLDRGQVVALLQGAAAMAVSSRSEPFGISVLEAWRAGAPLVVTTRGGPPDFVADGVDGLLRDPEDTAAFAAALREVVLDENTAARLSQAGSVRVADFTWDVPAALYEGLYERALAAHA